MVHFPAIFERKYEPFSNHVRTISNYYTILIIVHYDYNY